MAGFSIRQLNFKYSGQQDAALEDVHLQIPPGSVVLLGGTTGSGKTTLLRLLKKQVRPTGKCSGEVLYDGIPVEEMDERRAAEEIGMVFQNPDSQIVMNTGWQELCFGMENLGYPTAVMQKRMAEIVPFFGMESWLHKDIETLSGGQKQILNLAGVMMLRPRVLLLDEPTAQLDPIAASGFLDLLFRINREFSVTIVMSEHRLEELYGRVDQVCLMAQGRIAFQGTPREVLCQVWERSYSDFLTYLPSVSRLFLDMEEPGRCSVPVPLTVREARTWFDGFYPVYAEHFRKPSGPPPEPGERGETVVRCDNVEFRYERHDPGVLQGLSLELHRGELFALMGGNGSGKSTLLKVLAGVLRPQGGRLRVGVHKPQRNASGRPRTGYLSQNPVAYFCRDTLAEQLEERVESLGLQEASRLEELIDLFRLGPLLDRHPFDLSGGEQQKAALALVLLGEPDVLLLDEPTRGLDPVSRNELADRLKRVRDGGTAILMVSHDTEFCARHASRCGLLFGGRVMAVESPQAFFAQNHYYTTAVQRTVRETLGSVVTLEEVLGQWQQ